MKDIDYLKERIDTLSSRIETQENKLSNVIVDLALVNQTVKSLNEKIDKYVPFMIKALCILVGVLLAISIASFFGMDFATVTGELGRLKSTIF